MLQPFRFASLVALIGLVAGCSSGGSASPETGSSVVVTYSALGDVVSRLVGDAATVTVLIPNGQDQHDFSPSAKDIEELNNASFVVSNGLDLEEGLEDALVQTEKSGVPVFYIADYVTLRSLTAQADGHGGGKDPHIWLDPETLAEAVPALTAALEKALNFDLSQE